MERIIMYGTTWCGDCVRAKAVFENFQIDYDFVNIEEDEMAAQKVMEINNGKKVVPTLIIGKVPYTNPSYSELQELIQPYISKED